MVAWQWLPWRWMFDGQRVVWSSLLLALLPDCTPHVDPKIKAKLGDKADKRSILEEIYRMLGILDSKASALMRYDGVILAVVAITLRQVEGSGSAPQPLPHIGAILYLTLLSIVLCLFVVGVFWRFLDFVDPRATPDEQIDRELDMIRRVLVLREAFYQVAWLFAAVVAVLILLGVPVLVERAGAR